MKVFITGATGFIGSALTEQLIKSGHQVVGLCRSDKSAEAFMKLGGQVLRGDLNDLEVLKKGALESDGVAHLGFIHDFANFEASCETDKQAILAMSSVLKGTNKPLVASFGTLFLPNDHIATEQDRQPLDGMIGIRVKNEVLLLDQAKEGVGAMALRLAPTVYGKGDNNFMPTFVAAARKNGKSAYIGNGCNVWPTVARADAARLYKLALEHPIPGTVLHGVHEPGVLWKDIATCIGKQLNLPTVSIQAGEEAVAHFGLLGNFVSVNNPVSSQETQRIFQWKPKGPGLLANLEQGHYFAPPVAKSDHI